MTTAPAGVLHVTAAEGGGADRYVRDLAAATRPRHWIWHAGAGLVEDVATRRYRAAPDGTAVRDFVDGAGIGLVHAHGVDAHCQATLAVLASAVPTLPWVATLHDVGFLAPDAFATGALVPDREWIARVRPWLARAATVVVPSGYIADLVATHLALATTRVEPGLPDPRLTSTPRVHTVAHDGTRPVVAVVGAIGPHKGSGELDAMAVALANHGIRLVVIGYTDECLVPRPAQAGRYAVHGPYEDGQLPTLLRAYGARLALFVNRLPESFSYTLSETWQAGCAVLVPDTGALGERVRAWGGGAVYPPDATTAAVATQAASLVGAMRQVESAFDPHDPRRVPQLATMASAFDALYERFGIARDAPADAGAALDRLAAANLDGHAFRHELTLLAQLASEQRQWIAKLERDVAELKAAVTAQDKRDEALAQQVRELKDVEAAFHELPVIAQKLLFKRAFRGRR
ncbi:MAG: glycosyltransferase family 4 protein [Proteobacteria bacterium]|nr:glycosyltransferase family 4 protein [Pseudomonadota bacterium]